MNVPTNVFLCAMIIALDKFPESCVFTSLRFKISNSNVPKTKHASSRSENSQIKMIYVCCTERHNTKATTHACLLDNLAIVIQSPTPEPINSNIISNQDNR